MKNNFKKLLYVVSFAAFFLLSLSWLFVINEGRIAIYIEIFLISILLLDYIVNPKIRYLFIINFIVIVCFLLLLRLEIIQYLSL